jgi:hypothetical protein
VNAATSLRCAGCGREWLDPAERWRGYVAAEEEREHEYTGPDMVAVFCPECAESEFAPVLRSGDPWTGAPAASA